MTEHLVGLGERYVRLDQRGRVWTAGIHDLLAAEAEDTYHYVPLLYSSAGYAVLVESHAPIVWDLREPWSMTNPEGARTHVFEGTPMDCVRQATAITGRPPVPPEWAFGVWTTTLSGTEAVLRQADRMRAEDIPVTACWVYDHYDEATNSGCGMTGPYPSGDYPSLPALTAGLHDLGMKALTYVQPCLFAESAPWREAKARGWLVPGDVPYFNPLLRPDGDFVMTSDGSTYVDLTNEDAAAFYASLLDATLDQGWDGWMQDMGEHLPEGGTARNEYPLRYHRLAHSVWSQRPGTSVFARSGALGSAAYVPVVWPGDQHRTWAPDRGLPSVLPAGPSAGLCGVGAFGPDIAGIVGGGPDDEELWIRWCQYGALNPVMRDHGGFNPDVMDLWSTPATRRVFREYARLHTELLPYLYALAVEANATGVPIVRALLLHYPEHDEAWTISDQYLLGPDLLVAPVHERGQRERRVWFPPGGWTSWWDETRYEGPAWVSVPAPLERIPLFRRS